MIRNRAQFPETAAHQTALDCLSAGIEAAHPERVVRASVSLDGDCLTVGTDTYDLDAYEQVLVLGGGNAAAQVTAALEGILGDRLTGGVVVTDSACPTDSVEVLPASHPIPSERGVESTRTLLERAAKVGSGTLVLAPITGGGSACLVAPAAGLELSDIQETTAALLESGAPIEDINAVRKHLSAIKGGRLAGALSPARVVALVLSDVVGDDLSTIASGPLVAAETTYADARAALEAYEVAVPEAVSAHLAAGAAGDHDETPTAGDPALARVSTHSIGSNMTALRAARDAAADRGYGTLVLSSRMRGAARDAALAHIAIAEEIAATGTPIDPPAVVLSGGETTVAVRGDGTGGPNQEFALAAARNIPPSTVVAAVDTDGIDGPTEVAGAMVDERSVTDPDDAERALAANDSTRLLAERDALVETGPTGTNVNDLRLLVVERGGTQ